MSRLQFWVLSMKHICLILQVLIRIERESLVVIISQHMRLVFSTAMLYYLNTYFNTCCSPHCCPRHRPGLSDRQCSFKTQKHIDFHSGYSCLLSDLYSKPLSVVPCSGFFPTERKKAGAHCTTFGVRKEEGLLL